jgi:hypothetical protein
MSNPWYYQVDGLPPSGTTVWLRFAMGNQPPVQGMWASGSLNAWVISGWIGSVPRYFISKWRYL